MPAKMSPPTRATSASWAKHLLPLTALWFFALGACAQATVVISEIMYHPVEEPSFNADGTPILDLYEDVHEFIELHNDGTNTVSLAGWQISGGVNFVFT